MVSQSLCGVADLSQMHESDFPGSYVVIILPEACSQMKKRADWFKKHKKQKKNKTPFSVKSLLFVSLE